MYSNDFFLFLDDTNIGFIIPSHFLIFDKKKKEIDL